MGSVYGHLFRISTFGESHGGGVGVVLEGCPPGWRSTSKRSNAISIAAAPDRVC